MSATAKKIQIPPRLGGGDVVMRPIKTGEIDDSLSSHPFVKGKEAAAMVGHQVDMLHATIVTFRGKGLPVGIEREAWWRGLDGGLRAFLVGLYNKMNAVDDEEIASFFDAAETVREGTPAAT